jgi:hypothetical protein
MTTTVKVARFRDETDHLFRLANVDYHACVSVHEVENWKTTAARVLAETEGLECSRANAYDREQFDKALGAIKARLAEADIRIGQLQTPREVVGPGKPTAQNGTDEKTNRTPAEFKEWAIAHKSLAMAVCAAKALAELERERVDAYVLPIFRSFCFADEAGKKIEDPKYLFLSEDEAMCQAYFARCDAAHRAHGFTGPEGHCPALQAESLLISAQHALLQAGCDFLGIEVFQLYGGGNQEKKMLDLLLRACVSAQ